MTLGHLPKSFVHEHPQTHIRFELNLDDRGDRNLFLYNSVERNTERHLRALLPRMPRDLTFFDCGANIGFYSLLIQRLLPSAKVHSFEPLPEAFAHLQKNIALNGFNNIRAHRIAISNKDGQGNIYVGGQATAASLIPAPGKNSRFDVETMSIDSYCAREQMTRVDVMKIDTEGTEWNVIEGAQKTLEANPRILLILEAMEGSVRGAAHSEADLFQKLIDFGFDAYIPRGWPLGLKQIDRYPPGYADNLFFFRER